MNVDQQEIAKFEAVAERWWDLEGEFKPLHQLNPLRLEWITRYSGGLTGKSILDVGCGGGILAEAMALQGGVVTGVDMGREPLQVARLHALEQGVEVKYQLSTAEALAESMPEHFEIVTCMEMLEHVPDPAAIVKACAQLVKPEGMVFFSTINRNPKSYLHLIVGAEYVLNFVPKGTHNWKKFITPAELARMCRQAGLDVVDTKGMKYNLLTKEYSISDTTDTNYMIACRPA